MTIKRNRSKKTKIDKTLFFKIVLERIEITYNKYKLNKFLINGYSSLRSIELDSKRSDPKWY